MRRSPTKRVFSPDFPNLERGLQSGRAILTLVGNSLTRGQGAGSDGIQFGAYPLCPAALIAKRFANIGGTQGCYSPANGAFAATSDTYYSPAATYGDWLADSSSRSLWGPLARNSTTTTAVTYQPVEDFSVLEAFIWYLPGGGVYTISIDGNIVDTINMNVTEAFISKKYYVGLGQHTVAYTRVSGTCLIAAMRVYDHTRPCFQVETAAISGRTTVELSSDNSYLFNLRRGAASVSGSHAYMVEFGVNDRQAAALTTAQFKTNLKIILSDLRATGGDVCDVIPVPSSLSASPQADQDASWRQVHYEACAELGLMPPLDTHAMFGDSYAAYASYYQDFYHPLAIGYSYVGDAYIRKLLGR